MDESNDQPNVKAPPATSGPFLRIDPRFEPPRPTYNIPLQAAGIFATAAFALAFLGISFVVMMYFKQKDNVPVPLHFTPPGAGLEANVAGATDKSASAPTAVRK